MPPYRHLVIDEAHRLEGVATQQYGATLNLRALADQLATYRSHEPQGEAA
ncbi:MAG: hypothetical protein KY433_12610 [Actinobacteria bacterium]|nr:hypothetical protein [Actinomycetota bacterium]